MAKISKTTLIFIICLLLQQCWLAKANLPGSEDEDIVLVNKCCEKFEIRIDSVCSQVNESGKCCKQDEEDVRKRRHKN